MVKMHFPLKSLVITSKSLFNKLCNFYLTKLYEKRDLWLAKILQVDWMLSSKLLMYIKIKEVQEHNPVAFQILKTLKKRSDP